MSTLHKSFFDRPVLEVAPDLLGTYLVRPFGNKEVMVRITEVEAYDGPMDKACHAYKGRTARTNVMFGPAGMWYVYLIYGMYDMLNIVTGPENYPAAVLIRGGKACQGDSLILDGPGKLTRELEITKAQFNERSVSKETGLWIEDRGEHIPREDIVQTPRIGVAYAAECAAWPYRFVLEQK